MTKYFYFASRKKPSNGPMEFILGLQPTWDLHVYIHPPGDELWMGQGSFPHDVAYFRLDVNNNDGMKSTDLTLTEKEIILLDKKGVPCESNNDEVKIKNISWEKNLLNAFYIFY
jgi:hypothetical protein